MKSLTSKISKELTQELVNKGFIYENELPTYADVFDWFMEKEIVITLEPFFTFTLANHTGYTWKVSYMDAQAEDMIVVTENDKWEPEMAYGGSFPYAADDAIRFAITLI